jgi:hypothetical protein
MVILPLPIFLELCFVLSLNLIHFQDNIVKHYAIRILDTIVYANESMCSQLISVVYAYSVISKV